MKYLKTFLNHSEYSEYTSSDDIWLPRVSYILNAGEAHTSDDKFSDDGPSYIDFSRIGTEFVQIANDGTMYFTDQIYDNVKYEALLDGDILIIRTRDLETGEFTNDAYVDEENETIVINYPPGSGNVTTFSLN